MREQRRRQKRTAIRKIEKSEEQKRRRIGSEHGGILGFNAVWFR
jgi:hypothetical protein